MSSAVRIVPPERPRGEAAPIPRALPVVAVALGIAGDRALGWPPGLGAGLAAGACVIAFVVLHRRSLDAARWGAALAALTAAAGLAWRDSPVLHALDVILFAAALGLLASGAATPASLGAHALRVARTAAYTALGAPPVLGRLPWSRLGHGPSWRLALALARGLLLATPVVLLFALLLSNADAVFALRLRALVDVDLAALVRHTIVAAALSWLAAGLLNAGVSARGPALPGRPAWTAAGAVEAAVVLGLVDLLFGGSSGSRSATCSAGRAG
jgi:hypothetical protein